MPGAPEGFSIDERLAVYGSLAPGEHNAHVLAPLAGEWTEGEIIGTLQPITEGYAAGYRGIRLDGGDAVPCMLFSSHDLPGFWPTLDHFEGAEFFRTIVQVQIGDSLIEANLYEWRPSGALDV